MRNSKKTVAGNMISLVMVILLVLGMIAALGSTYEWAEQKFCEHTFGEKVVLAEVECGLDGVSEKTCTKCGHTKREAIPALGGSCDYVEMESGGYECRKCGSYTAILPNRPKN